MTGGGPGAGLAVRGLRVSYRTSAGVVAAVRGVDLDVAPGEVVALVGSSGSGKSSIAHAVLGLLPGTGRVDGGSVAFDGLELTRLPERAMRAVRGRRIALVPQDPGVALNPTTRVGTQVAEVLRIHGLADRRTAAARAVELLDRAGLPDPELRARQYPHELSGGMRQRALIAIAVAARPALIVADEPTSALDVTVQKRVLDQLEELRQDSGTALLLVTHDLGVAADRADRIVVLEAGEVVEAGATRAVLATPGHDATRTLVAAAPGLTAPPPPLPPASAETLLVADGLVKRFPLPGRRHVTAVDGVGFTVHRGETLALVGESGSGKSTTARLVLGLAQADAGSATLDGVPVTGADRQTWRDLRRRMQIVQQNPYASLEPRWTVADIVTEPLRTFGVGDRSARSARARELLDRVAMPAAALARRPAELSGGQRQRVAIARALALSPELVVLDEPVSALDVSVQAQVLELLAELQREQGLAYLFVSHDLAVVRRVAHRVAVLQHGRVVETGPVEEVLVAPRHAVTAELVAAVPGRSPQIPQEVPR